MEKDNTEQSSQAQTKLIHVQVIDGSSADVFDIGQALKKFKANVELPYRLEFIITDDKVHLKDLDMLIQQLMELKRQVEHDKKLSK